MAQATTATTSSSSTTRILTEAQLADYEADGFLYLPGLLRDNADFQRLQETCRALVDEQRKERYHAFSVMEMGAMFYNSTKAAEEDSCGNNAMATDFRKIAMSSVLSEMATELLKFPETGVYILRDVFLAKPTQPDATTCGWHVDDQSFWPQCFMDEPHGTNMWLALDDMEHGGTMVVAKGSHRAEFRHAAYRAIGQDRTQEHDKTEQDLLDVFVSGTNNTCGLATSDPELHEIMEGKMVEFDIRAGDVIFAHRLLFHRTTATQPTAYGDQKELNRYSVRYVPGNARLPIGFSLEPSILLDDSRKGEKLDKITSGFYPRVWPTPTSDAELDAIQADFQRAKDQQRAEFGEIMKKVAELKQAKAEAEGKQEAEGGASKEE